MDFDSKQSDKMRNLISPYLPKRFESSFPVVQLVKNPPAMQETPVQFLGWADPLEKGMATHSSILAWRLPRTQEPGGLESLRAAKSQTQLSNFHSLYLLIPYYVFPLSTGNH